MLLFRFCPSACGAPPCCGPCGPPDSYVRIYENKPYVQCTMLCPPPCLIPTEPRPVKPLQLPCPVKDDGHREVRIKGFLMITTKVLKFCVSYYTNEELYNVNHVQFVR